jgi:hypothetical protein
MKKELKVPWYSEGLSTEMCEVHVLLWGPHLGVSVACLGMILGGVFPEFRGGYWGLDTEEMGQNLLSLYLDGSYGVDFSLRGEAMVGV